jgi:hypothetical protein
MLCQYSGVEEQLVGQVTDSIDRLVALARVVDFDVLHGRAEPLARLVVEARYFVSLVGEDDDSFDTSQRVMRDLRRRRGLADES